MLDMITDFWKPAKKAQAQDSIRPDEIAVGSSIAFGFVPQASLSGRLLCVSAINTYQFGEEKLTSFTLSSDDIPALASVVASMIFAESSGEYYLAISRRVSEQEREQLFAKAQLADVMEKKEVTRLPLKEVVADFKGWTVASYKRQIQGMKGRFYRGDFRGQPLPSTDEAQEFDYTLLVSDSNEHAIEVERYVDGRIEMFATVYRRLSDISEVNYSAGAKPVAAVVVEKPAPQLVAAAPKAPEPANPEPANANIPAEPLATEPVAAQPKPELKIAEPAAALPAAAVAAPTVVAPAVPVAISTDLRPQSPVVQPPAPAPKPMQWPELAARVLEEPASAKPTVVAPVAASPQAPEPTKTEPVKPAFIEETKGVVKPMSTLDSDIKRTNVIAHPASPEMRPVATVARAGDANAIECELHVANKIISEAIRSETCLSDVVRRVVELPVSSQGAVQIPLNLSDEDYALLAIRYGISASDREAIRRRIIEDLSEFSSRKTA